MVFNRSRASSTRTRPTLTHIGWRVKENFPETFKSQLEKSKNVIHRPRSVCTGRNCALGLSIRAVDVSAGPGGVRHQIRPIRMRHLWSDFGAWKEPFTEVYVVKFSLYSKLV